MKLFIILILLACCNTVNAQCPSGDVELGSQSDVDNFVNSYPNCTTINGAFKINGSDISDISGLINIEQVDSLFRIDFTILTDLTGLDNLDSVAGDFFITNNNLLTDISALGSLTSLPKRLTIANNDALLDLTGIENVTYIGEQLLIATNDALGGLTGVENITTIGSSLSIINNINIANITALNNLTSIGGNLQLQGNDNLSDITGLSNLQTIGGQLIIFDNDALTSLDGLENIDFTTITNLNISSSNLLSFCEVQSICDYLVTPSNPATISGNASGCFSRSEVEMACNALPVELISFHAESNDKFVNLSWKTASEINNQGFYIQKSRDGINWQNVAFIDGKGTTSTKNDYQYIDIHPFSGASYYRLKQVDFDGAFEYSEVVSVRLEKEANESFFFPNPASDVLNIQVPSTLKSNKIESKIITLNGQVIREDLRDSDQFQIDISSLPKGIYILKINNYYFKRFIKI